MTDKVANAHLAQKNSETAYVLDGEHPVARRIGSETRFDLPRSNAANASGLTFHRGRPPLFSAMLTAESSPRRIQTSTFDTRTPRCRAICGGVIH